MAAPAPKNARTPADAPAGDWVVERVEVGGAAVVATGDKPRYGLRVGADGLTLLGLGADGQRWPGTTEPAAFFSPVRGGKAEADLYPDDPKRLRKAIWKIDGDTLTVCEAAPGDEWPGEFAAPKGSRRTLWVLKRMPKK